MRQKHTKTEFEAAILVHFSVIVYFGGILPKSTDFIGFSANVLIIIGKADGEDRLLWAFDHAHLSKECPTSHIMPNRKHHFQC